VLLDRGRHWDVLHWLWLLNSHPDPLKQYLHGDKDSFLIAFYMAGKAQEYQQVREGGSVPFSLICNNSCGETVWCR
jgi:hypothetical protein